MLQKEIQEAIEKSLPLQVGQVLKTRLEQADKDAVKLKQQEESLASKNATITGLEKRIEEYVKFNERNLLLEAREKAVEEKERNLKLATLEFQLASEKEKTEFTKSVAMGLVRNSEYRKNIFDNENQTGYYNGTTWVQPTPISKSLTETKTQD